MQTRRFQQALFDSDLPPAALDAVSANTQCSRARRSCAWRMGHSMASRGCHPDAGCCEGSCTHVWNYAQALPFLFPALGNSMRNADYVYNQRPDDGYRSGFSYPRCGLSSFRPCADGRFGNVLKVYRDWKICGDTGGYARSGPRSGIRSSLPGRSTTGVVGTPRGQACCGGASTMPWTWSSPGRALAHGILPGRS